MEIRFSDHFLSHSSEHFLRPLDWPPPFQVSPFAAVSLRWLFHIRNHLTKLKPRAICRAGGKVQQWQQQQQWRRRRRQRSGAERWWRRRQSGRRENNSVCGGWSGADSCRAPTPALPPSARPGKDTERKRASERVSSACEYCKFVCLWASPGNYSPPVGLSAHLSVWVWRALLAAAAAGACSQAHTFARRSTILHLDWQWKWNRVRIWLRHWRTRRAGGRACAGK